MFSKIRHFYDWLGYQTFMVTATMYLAAASLIGFETLAVLIGYATIWPVGIPFAIVAIGVYAVVKRRLARTPDNEDRVG